MGANKFLKTLEDALAIKRGGKPINWYLSRDFTSEDVEQAFKYLIEKQTGENKCVISTSQALIVQKAISDGWEPLVEEVDGKTEKNTITDWLDRVKGNPIILEEEE